MADYDNTNKGALFGNDDKREGKKDPDLRGKLNIGGVDHWISGWFHVYEKDGGKKKMIQLSLGEAVEKKASKPSLADLEDDVPF